MKNRTFLPVCAALVAACFVPTVVSAQFSKNTNQSRKYRSVIAGGSGNLIPSNTTTAVIGGGKDNRALSVGATVDGGEANTAGVVGGGSYATVGGGLGNVASNSFAVVGGGYVNTASGFRATISGGSENIAGGDYAVVAGGATNTADGDYATVAGGATNTAGFMAVVGGGLGNVADGNYAFIGGGSGNTASFIGSTVGGGFNNTAGNDRAVVGGGDYNSATGKKTFVGGGTGNMANSDRSAVVGGDNNHASGSDAFVGGGTVNVASGENAVVPGGAYNEAAGSSSFAAGRRAKATAAGQFIWADSQDKDYYGNWADRTDTFSVRARTGVTFSDGGNPEIEMYWKPSKTAWTYTSDKAAKENFREIDPREVLRHLASLTISEWNYKGYAERNIGPMAQDWHRAFPSLGESDKTINSGDVQGVSLAAIQGLFEELKERDSAIKELKAKLEAVEERLGILPPAPGQ